MTSHENFIDSKCPYCGGPVSFREDTVGRAQECPNCAESLVVPREPSEFAGKIPLPITTPRLVLRRLAVADWKDLLEFLSDEELHQYVEGAPLSEEQTLKWLETDRHVKLTTPNTTFCLGMELQSSGKVIGNLYLNFTDEFRVQANITIYVRRSFQRQGFATEAVNGMLGLGFEGIGWHRVIASCDSRNVAARGLCEKVGMRKEGEFLKDRFVNAEWVNTLWYALLRDEYWTARAIPPPKAANNSG